MSTTRSSGIALAAAPVVMLVAAAVLSVGEAGVAAGVARAVVPEAGVADADAAGEPVLQELWRRTIATSGRGVLTGTAADLDGDGRDELLLHCGSGNGRSDLIVLDPEGRELWRADFDARSCALAADLDADGRKEVVAACGGDLFVLDGADGRRIAAVALRGPVGDIAAGESADGTFLVCTSGAKQDDDLVVFGDIDLAEIGHLQAQDVDGRFARGFTYPTALDTDGDGADEIVVAENGNRLLCLSARAELLWDVGLGRRDRLDPQGVVSARPVVADLLGDGAAELAVGCFAGDVVVLDPRAGEVLDRATYGRQSHEEHLGDSRIPRFIREALGRTGEPVNCLTPVEVDRGPGLELVLGCSDESLYAFDPGGGGTVWQTATNETVYDPCLIMDDGSLLAWDVTGVYVIDPATGELAGEPDRVRCEMGDTSTVLRCELDGQQGPEYLHVALSAPVVTAWRVASGANSGSGSAGSVE